MQNRCDINCNFWPSWINISEYVSVRLFEFHLFHYRIVFTLTCKAFKCSYLPTIHLLIYPTPFFFRRATERVLPAARVVHYALQNELGINNFVGVTLGKVYCGIVGGIKRHEYAVLGSSVNLSARLLSMPNHPGIIVDNCVRQEAMSWGSFLAFPPMKAKGYSDLVAVYQPLTAREARWGKVNPHFVGRRDEMNHLCDLAKKMAVKQGPPKLFFVWGESGSGKSDFLVQTVAHTRKSLISMRKGVVVLRNIGSDGDALVPFR